MVHIPAHVHSSAGLGVGILTRDTGVCVSVVFLIPPTARMKWGSCPYLLLWFFFSWLGPEFHPYLCPGFMGCGWLSLMDLLCFWPQALSSLPFSVACTPQPLCHLVDSIPFSSGQILIPPPVDFSFLVLSLTLRRFSDFLPPQLCIRFSMFYSAFFSCAPCLQFCTIPSLSFTSTGLS